MLDVLRVGGGQFLVGEGGERRRLEQYATGVERITFVDPLSDEDFRFALAAADVLLVNEKPGVSGMALPSKLTSYFDAARPIVAATDPDGITASEVAAADAGIVVRAGDPGALLDAILSLREDKSAASRYAANGKRYREDVLGEEEAIDLWSDVIKRVTAAEPWDLTHRR
jgi:glycosyltransferase involved in cell wall biosynthesis